jgi:phospholipid/cholesterol/gamma-HCH transport system substrate-binding protein
MILDLNFVDRVDNLKGVAKGNNFVNLLKAAEFKVGVLVLAVASLIAYMSLQVSDNPSFLSRNNDAWFLANNAGGLVKNSAVRMSGIPIGVIKDIRLQDGIARIDMTIRSDIPLFVSAAVEMKSQGILGDKYIEITPGSPTDPPLPRGGQILNVKEKGNLDGVIAQVGDIASNLKEVAAVLKESVAQDGTNKHVLGRIVLNIERLTQDLADVTSNNKEKINEIIDQVHGITDTLDQALNDESDAGFKATWKRTLTRVDSTMKNIDEITSKINNGEGTIGKLISDEETAENVSTAIEGINGFLDSAGKMSTGLELQSGYVGVAGGAKTDVNIKIQPGIDRYYLLGVTDDPLGVEDKVRTVTTGSASGDITEIKTFSNKMKMNLQFAKNIYDFTIRGGLIENSGGVGFDYNLSSRWKLSLDMFNFSNLNLRPVIRYQVWKGIYAFGGVHDALNKSGNFSSYIGAGLFITNDDLKLLMTKLPL